MKIERFEEIDAWKNSRALVNSIYRICAIGKFKKYYSLTDQIRRAAISIMANISEGFARKGTKEFIQFLFISKSSAAELQSHLYIACDQNYITKDTFGELYKEAEIIQRQLSNFIKYLQTTL